METLLNFLTDYTFRTVALGAAILGITSGALGSFAMLRKQSLLGDAISHAALPGVVIAFLLMRTKAPLVLILGAAVSGWLATLWMMSIVRYTRIKEDTALGLVLSTFFGVGVMLLTFTQRLPDARQAGLDQYLFGQAAALLERDVIAMAVLGGLALLLMALFWKELKLLSFDRDFGSSLGFPMVALDILLTTLLVISIVIGLQAVGVVLMSAMVVAPAAAARQWTNRLGVMVLLAAIFGAIAGVSGAVISGTAQGLSTGPVIVLVASLIVILSLLFAPGRGLIANIIRDVRNRRTVQQETILLDLYRLASQHHEPTHPHSAEVLYRSGLSRVGVQHTLQKLAEKGWVEQRGETEWALTRPGVTQAARLTGADGWQAPILKQEGKQTS
jgi:manganese/zinc/iron transport system permease protein